MKSFNALATAIILLLACGAALAQPVTDASALPKSQISLKLTAVVAALPPGLPWLSMRLGMLCSQDDIVKKFHWGP